MNKNQLVIISILVLILIGLFTFKLFKSETEPTNKPLKSENYNELEGLVISYDKEKLTIQDKNNAIYTFKLKENLDLSNKSSVLLKYSGTLNKDKSIQDATVIDCVSLNNEEAIPLTWNDNGIFSKFYKLAANDIKKMTLDEKISQLLLVIHPSTNDIDILKQYQFGGFVFFRSDFANKNKEEVQTMINNLQNEAKIPLLTAVDEEGGTVIRISSNPALASEEFKSPRTLYAEGGLDLIKEDTIKKSSLLKELGLNVNLAPVVDISTNPSDYMYERSLGEDTNTTSEFAKIVIEASKNSGVSYTLKHFPGYGNNNDTHVSSNVDSRSWLDIKTKDLPPFKAGIESGAESVLVSHNIVNSIDSTNPASLSTDIHNILRNELNFTGIIITDDISMGAVSNIDDTASKAILAGNELIITTDYEESFNSIKNAVNNGSINEELIDKLAFRVISWKYYKGLMYEKTK